MVYLHAQLFRFIHRCGLGKVWRVLTGVLKEVSPLDFFRIPVGLFVY
jgi:hypothetical protein